MKLVNYIKYLVASEQQSSLSDAAGEPDRHEEARTEETNREDYDNYLI